MNIWLKRAWLVFGAMILLGWLAWPASPNSPHEFPTGNLATQPAWSWDKTFAALLLVSVLLPLATVLLRRWAVRRLPTPVAWITVSAAGLTLLVIGLASLSQERVVAQSGFYANLPNGNAVYSSLPDGCALCHFPPEYFPPNTPGAFAYALYPFTSGASWGGHGSGSPSPAHNIDTDGDGFTNGEELQDPEGLWPYNAVTTNYRDTAYASNPNDATRYPPAPSITNSVGLVNGQTLAGNVTISTALRYAALNRVVYSFRTAGGEVYSYTAASPVTTNYANRFCLGTSPANTSPCAPWDSFLAPNGTYTVVVTAYDRRLVSSVFSPQTGVYTVTNVTVNNVNLLRYVATTGSDSSNNCTNNASPCATVQRAVDVANTGDEIRIAGGAYSGVSIRLGETQMAYITKTLTLRGGYTTSNWSLSDPVANPTTLNAQTLGRVLYITGTIAVTVENLRLINGRAALVGGGAYVYRAQVLFDQAEISGNSLTNSFGKGAGLYLDLSRTSIVDSTIANNTAPEGYGGGLYAIGSPLTVTSSLISGNQANSGGVGGGVYVNGAQALLSDNTFVGNSAGYGGGVNVEYFNTITVSANIFITNTANVYGGGLRLNTSNAYVVNNVFSGNFAGGNGGGGVGVWQSQPALQHNTFVNNNSVSGAAVNVFPGSPTALAVLTNTIIVSHTNTAVVALGGTTATLNGVLWFNNSANTGGGGVINVSNQHTGDPAFAPDGYHLLQSSAAVNQGVNSGVTTDIDGETRPQLLAMDLGADEFTPSPLINVVISGPPNGFLNLRQEFSATIGAVNPTRPITYTWQAAEQTPVIHNTNSLTDTVAFTWTVAGSKLISVTATNAAGSVVGNYLWNGEPAAAVEFGFTFAGLVGTGADTRSLSLGDVNGDGTLDVVLGYQNAPAQVYLNDGAANFSLAATLGGGASTANIALGDFNSDGALDVALTNSGVASQVFLNDGSGAFPVTHTVGGAASGRSISAGDFNNDGRLDIVLGYVGSPAQVFVNDGAGNFSLLTTLGALGPAASTTSLAVGDVDNSGSLDIVVGNFNQNSQVFLNDGAGGFTAGSVLGSGANATSVALGDVNGDDLLDIALDATIYLNAGTGNFPASYSIGSGGSAFSMKLGDVNGDGALDVVLGQGFSRPTQVYLNNGVGAFSLVTTLGSGAFTRSVILGDLDADGALDIILGNVGQPNQIFLNNGSINFALAMPLGGSAKTYQAVVGDLNGDGALDVALANGDGVSALYFNDGTSQFPLTGSVGSGAVTTTTSLALADLTGDGALDVVLGNGGQASQVYQNNGVGGFSLLSTLGSATGTQAVATADLNGDGRLDVVLGRSGQPSQIYINHGAGVFSLSGDLGSGAASTSLALGDLNGDGALDVVLGNYEQASQVYLNNGLGGFSLTASLGANVSTYALALGDLNNDGAPDVTLGNFYEPTQIFWNDGAGNFAAGPTLGSGAYTHGLALGDLNGDGTLDVILGNGFVQPTHVYLNDGAGQFTFADLLESGGSTYSAAVGDFNRDGALDVVLGNYQEASLVYLNQLRRAGRLPDNPPTIAAVRPGLTADASFFSTPVIQSDQTIAVRYSLFDPEGHPASVRAYYSPDGGGQWYPALAAGGTATTLLTTLASATATYTNSAPLPINDFTTITSSLTLTPTREIGVIADINVRINVSHTYDSDLVIRLVSPSGQTVMLAPNVGGSDDNFIETIFDDEAATPITSGAPPFTGAFRPAQALSLLDDQPLNGTWSLVIADTAGQDIGTLNSWSLNITLKIGAVHTYTWDVAASGFFGQSDNVVLRLEAYPDSHPVANETAGPYQRPYASVTTFPFRVRGTQVRVMDGATPAANALVYRLPNGQTTGGVLMGDSAGNAFLTDSNGYLQGRGQLQLGDQLLALAPITRTETYTLYHTNGIPNAGGVVAHTVSASGVQTITVSAANPLYLFTVFASLEWDSTQDPAYLEQLQFNLQRASEYLYDFSNGQAALGSVVVEQNADDWGYANILIHANNRLRPFAAQGGIVTTETVDFNPVLSDVVYAPGQVHMGATWNRYGTPGTTVGEDWAITLGHELSHYLFFLDDVYLGLDNDGFLIPINTCQGSAMGDYYSDPANSEYLADEAFWQANCSQTLTEQTLQRNEWETVQGWYSATLTPSVINAGPSLMPFDFTSVQVFDPITPTNPFIDPTFYLNYTGGGGSSNESRAYLLRDGQYMIDLGSPFGGQNRVRAWGAKPTDRLCIFDRPRQQFGCEVLAEGDDQIQMKQDTTWNPLVQVTPVNSTTLSIQLEVPGIAPLSGAQAAITYPVQVRIFPEFGPGTAPATFMLVGSTYTRTITLTEPALNGQVQIWVDEPATELNPRREAMVAYSIGGNPGSYRAGGGSYRAGGGSYRAGGGSYRAGGGSYRAGGAPIVSPDGQMIFFTPNPIIFDEGEFFTVQGMAALPSLPPGRTVIGTGYRLVATPGTPVITGSVSIQYLSNDVTVAGANEEGLSVYFYTGNTWTQLETVRSPYFNLVTAPSQGVGVYALMASVQVPLYTAGWNLFAYPLPESQVVTEALASIDGYYSTVYGYYAEDVADPWKLYQTGVPTYVNDLATLDFGRGYWISATQAITIHFSPTPDSLVSIPASPPDTFYGDLLSSGAFVPAPDLLVQAYVGGVLCGQGLTRNVNGSIVYVVDVFADDVTGQWAGCGQVGRVVRFVVQGQSLLPTALWNNTTPTELNLSPGTNVYLPVIRR